MFDWSNYILFVLIRGSNLYSLQIMIFVYVPYSWGIVELKTRFQTWIKWNDLNGVSLFHFSYLRTRMAYLCSQRTRNIQIKYFMFDWSIYWLFVLNTTLKRDSLQMMIFVNVFSTWSIVHIKVAVGYVNNKKWRKWCKYFHISYLITLKSYCAHNGHQMHKSSICVSLVCAKLGLETWYSNFFARHAA
jgi:hypothetical protein